MKTKRVISYSQLPSNLPVNHTLLWLLFLDRVSAPGWVWGVFGTLLGVAWICAIVSMGFVEQTVELSELQDRRREVNS